MNPGISRTVALLNANGFRTTDSGDGRTHGFACDRDNGYVVAIVDDPATLSAEVDRLAALLVAHGVKVGPYTGEPNECVQVQGTYDACDKVAVIDVSPMWDELLAAQREDWSGRPAPDDRTQCSETHPDGGRCIYGTDHSIHIHNNGKRRWEGSVSGGSSK